MTTRPGRFLIKRWRPVYGQSSGLFFHYLEVDVEPEHIALGIHGLEHGVESIAPARLGELKRMLSRLAVDSYIRL